MKKILFCLLCAMSTTLCAQEIASSIRIENQQYPLIAPVANQEKLQANNEKLTQLLAEQQKISAQIQQTESPEQLSAQFDNILPLMVAQDKLVQDIFQHGIYSKAFLLKFIAFRKQFAYRLQKDFQKLVQAKVIDEKNAQRFLFVYDATTSEYESAFWVLNKKFL